MRTAPQRALARRPRLLLNLSAVLNTVGLMAMALSLTLVAPAIVAVVYGESLRPFLVPLVVGGLLGLLLERGTRGASEIGLREAFLVVSLVWIAAAGVGCLPYIIEGGDVSRPVDAYFEAMSGFTTTGSSAMADIESHGRAILFWRSLTQWLGGMGIIVLALAILPRLNVGGRQLMRHEAPGPELEKLAPRIRDTARRLWLLYVGFTVAEVVLLVALGVAGHAPGMDLYNALVHAFATMSTGGFSPEARSLEPFGAWAQWVVIAFMAAAGVNFALWYRGLTRGPREFAGDEELRLYLAAIAVATAVLAVALVDAELVSGTHDAVRHALFQTVTIVTTTGFASADFAVWTPLALYVLVVLMFIGGCAGSTSGAMKVVRIQLVARVIRREIRTMVHPEAVRPVRVSGRPVGERALAAALAFVVLYILIFAFGATLLLLDASSRDLDLGAFDAVAAAATTIGNIGPGLGFAGPMGSFAPFGDTSIVVMTVLMWVGRLELLPVLALLTRSYWVR